MDSSLTRSEFLKAAGGAAAGMLWLGSEAGSAAAHASAVRRAGARHRSSALFHSFVSRPDLRPPRAAVHHPAGHPPDRRGGLWFLTAGTNAPGVQNGPVILDQRGQPVWFKPMPKGWFSMDLRTQTYRGRPVLTWWEGTILGSGEAVIMDTSYREIARVRAGNGHQVDPHEFLLTPDGTALITCSPSTVSADLSSVGGGEHGQVAESVIQEIDVQTGRVLLEWRSLEHVSVSESYMWPGHGVYDFMHANSIDITPDGNLLVSGRHTWALYKLERLTGRIMWRLGGKRSDFAMGHGTQFAWQHDARQVDDRTLTVFDDGAAFFEGNHRYRQTHSQSRGLALGVDHGARKVHLGRSYRHRPELITGGFGNMQTLPDGDVVVGWGDLPVFSQFNARGTALQDVNLPAIYASYRAYRQPWAATPAQRPTVVARRHPGGRATTVYASWNGATGYSGWAVRTGPSPSDLRRVATRKRQGFETAIDISQARGYVSVTALDSAGRALAHSLPIRL